MIDRVHAKDFIQTREGLIFAVVAEGLENGKVLCFLRYVWQEQSWQKLATADANQFLTTHHPHYLFFSEAKSAHLHAVDVLDIDVHHQPKQRLQDILVKKNADAIEQDLRQLCQVLLAQGVQLQKLGITGSLLIGAQNSASDIDLVVYDRHEFHKIRHIIGQLIAKDVLQSLDEQAWADSYQRRQCDLSYADYIWHEQRKYNKALINQRKFDLNLMMLNADERAVHYTKQGQVTMCVKVLDAQYGFDYPAKFLVEDDQVSEVVCYTATYTGQAVAGEYIEVSGQLEISSAGQIRILVGSTREATGEYIKVVSEV